MRATRRFFCIPVTMPVRPRFLFFLLFATGPAWTALAAHQAHAGTAVVRPDAGLVFYAADEAAIARIDVEIADNEASRARGLMGRTLTDDQSGMLFVYSDAAPRAFWMRNTPGSLDILFADSQRRIIRIARETKPFSDRNILSHGPAKYVVEVRGGFAQRRGIAVGTRFDYYPSPFARNRDDRTSEQND